MLKTLGGIKWNLGDFWAFAEGEIRDKADTHYSEEVPAPMIEAQS
jgi:hypothetical protein